MVRMYRESVDELKNVYEFYGSEKNNLTEFLGRCYFDKYLSRCIDKEIGKYWTPNEDDPPDYWFIVKTKEAIIVHYVEITSIWEFQDDKKATRESKNRLKEKINEKLSDSVDDFFDVLIFDDFDSKVQDELETKIPVWVKQVPKKDLAEEYFVIESGVRETQEDLQVLIRRHSAGGNRNGYINVKFSNQPISCVLPGFWLQINLKKRVPPLKLVSQLNH